MADGQNCTKHIAVLAKISMRRIFFKITDRELVDKIAGKI